MYSEKVFQLGDSLLLTNAGMGNIQNTILLLKALYGDLYNIDDLINELK
ncbi:TPA: hypothetical protein RIO42_005851, partial [Bacillus anthracis]|nr:hypothetical protein [Bacillus anthracis]